ncbi:MAG: tRNA guanosine(34) transglycosylase Tgt [Acidobacteria bacterium]|jgi:queuine tRNA-ribosyltransferase|nr:tRNA guanosine(34) transglycosylase Tgt [Acidobacteriota bacterium]
MAAVTLTIHATDGAARTGTLATRRGPVATPAFMPVGTAGSVKGLMPGEVRELGAEIVLANTYHLHVRPGEALVRQLGGLHAFSGWEGPILTDSGGYQVFSLARRRTIDDDGVTFLDHVEGSPRRLTPESSIAIQQALGSDVMMALDDCTGAPGEREAAARAMERTRRWLARNLAARTDPGAALFGIVQGGTFDDLREESLAATAAEGFDGVALGGVSVGEGRAEVRRIVATFGPRLPAGRPRYLMGMGRPEDLVEAVASGFDMFDCVLPTRHGRTAQLFTSRGLVNVRNARYRDEAGPADPECGCPVCRRFSLAYLRHLYTAGEMLGPRAGTVHNLWFYLDLMRRMREAIAAGSFAAFRAAVLARLDEGRDREEP